MKYNLLFLGLIAKSLNSLFRMKKPGVSVTQEAATIVYNALIGSKISYGITLRGSSVIAGKEGYYQKKAIRIRLQERKDIVKNNVLQGVF